MQTLLSLLQSIIFGTLSLLHFSWAFGSKWGLDKALPANAEGVKVLNPGWFDTTIVAIGLALFATYYLVKGNIITLNVPSFILTYAGWAISAIFILRAMGDFKYVGFFKRITGTEFASFDTMFYSPLCLVLGLVGVWLEIK